MSAERRYQRGAGLLTAELDYPAGIFLTASQPTGAGDLVLKTTSGVSDVRGASDKIEADDTNDIMTWSASLHEWTNTEIYPNGNAFHFEFLADDFEVTPETADLDPEFRVLKPITTTWNNTQIRDLLGFTGSETWTYTLQGALLTATRRPQGIWYAGCPMVNPYGHGKPGHYVSDLRRAVSPLGHVRSLVGNRLRRLDGIYWSHVVRDLALTDELDLTSGVPTSFTTASNTETRSFEEFLKGTQWGDYSLFEPGSVIRLYWDWVGGSFPAYLATDYLRARMLGGESTQLEMSVQGWDRYFSVRLPPLIEVPA
jgi:hypothetical protein